MVLANPLRDSLRAAPIFRSTFSWSSMRLMECYLRHVPWGYAGGISAWHCLHLPRSSHQQGSPAFCPLLSSQRAEQCSAYSRRSGRVCAMKARSGCHSSLLLRAVRNERRGQERQARTSGEPGRLPAGLRDGERNCGIFIQRNIT